MVCIPTLSDIVLELVHNSLDADSHMLEIVVGGEPLRVCVKDDGNGIARGDLSRVLTINCDISSSSKVFF